MLKQVSPSKLARRISKHVDQGKGVALSPAELDLLVVSGAYEKLVAYANEHQRDKCLARGAWGDEPLQIDLKRMDGALIAENRERDTNGS